VIDTHAHLYGVEGGADEAVERAAEAGVTRIVCIGALGLDDVREAVGLAERHVGIFATAGIHPHHALEWDEQVRAELDGLVQHPCVVAVGECGLDYYRDRAPREAQMRAFEGQVELAERHEKPLVIHTRDATEDTLGVLRGTSVPVVLHCFSLTDELQECIERGWYCSFAGNVTYPAADDLRAAAAAVPAELLLLETDAPYLAPVPHRGKPNRPEFVLDTLRAVAAARGDDVDELAATLQRNAERVFVL
jgi:TatD DNase family protein